MASRESYRLNDKAFGFARGSLFKKDFPRSGQILPAPGRNVTVGDKEGSKVDANVVSRRRGRGCSPQRRRFRRKQASASCRFPLRPLPVKKQTGKARRLCRFANIKNSFSADIATATTAACGRSREELLGPWPAGCKARSRAVADAGGHNSSRAKRRQFQIVTSSSAVPPAHPGA